MLCLLQTKRIANNAKTIVQGTIEVASLGTAVAAIVQLANQEATALKAYQDARDAIMSCV